MLSLSALFYNKPAHGNTVASALLALLLLCATSPEGWAQAKTAAPAVAKPASAKPLPAKSAPSDPMAQATQWVNQANQYAALENYEKAIPLYEKAVALLPGETTLKKNLAVLYANYGMGLQRDKHYAEAAALFEKSLKLIPNQPEVIEAKAANVYLQAMALREVQPVDYAKMHQLLDQAVALNPKEQAFIRNKAGVYQEEARDLVAVNNLEGAAEALEKAQAIEPQNSVLRVSRVNLYLKIGQDKLKQTPDQKEVVTPWFDKAKALDSSAETEEKMKAILANPSGPPMQGAPVHSFLAGGSQADGQGPTAVASVSKSGQAQLAKQLPAAASKLTVVEMLSDIEKQLGQDSEQAKKPLKDRLEALESQVFGAPQTGVMSLRVKALYSSVLGERTPQDHGSQPDLVQEPVQTTDNAYLDAVFKTTEGRVIRWNKFPLRVFIADGKDNNRYKPEYTEAVMEALEAWKTATGNFVTTVVVKNDQAADVVITWGDAYSDRFASIEDVPDYYKKYAVPKANPMLRVIQIASMLTPGYFSLAPQALGAALQYQQVKKLQALIDESKVTLGLAATDGLPPEAARMMVHNMAVHEFGHAIGLKGHSPEEGDALFPKLGTSSALKPTPRDIETLRQIYSRPANMVLNIR